MRYIVIAEIGCNHGGSMDKAKEYIRASKEAGADYAKFQYFSPSEVRAFEERRVVAGERSYYTEETFKAVEEAEFNLEQMRELKEYCREVGIGFLCTPYINPQKILDLVSIGCNRIKIRERDSNDFNFIKTAVDNCEEVFLSVSEWPKDPFILYHPSIRLLYCIPKYPPQVEDFNLRNAELYDGVSLHFPHTTYELASAVIALSEKSQFIVEKHITLSHNETMIDDAVSIEPSELRDLVSHLRRLGQLLKEVLA